MRLAHLHVPGLITYSQSLRLQAAILDRHFRYKDCLRSSQGSKGGANAQNTPVTGGTTSDVHAYRPTLDQNQGNASPAPNKGARGSGEEDDEHRQSASVRLNRSPANNTTQDLPCTSSLQTGKGSRITAPTSPSTPGIHIQERPDCAPPDPVLLTFSTPPTYTVGRRHLLSNTISTEQQSFLSANNLATFHASPRGGLLTYHAPGQVTGYVIADLRRHGITPRCWVKLLEQSVMRTCGSWGVNTERTDDPGVWVVNSRNGLPKSPTQEDTEPIGSKPLVSDRKICAIGVQVSRGVTSHGIGLNVYDAPFSLGGHASPSRLDQKAPTYDFTPAQVASQSYDPVTRGYLSWGFSRIVACGLEGKSVTWLTREMLPSQKDARHSGSSVAGAAQPTKEAVATILAREIMYGLNSMRGPDKETVDSVYRIEETDVLE